MNEEIINDEEKKEGSIDSTMKEIDDAVGGMREFATLDEEVDHFKKEYCDGETRIMASGFEESFLDSILGSSDPEKYLTTFQGIKLSAVKKILSEDNAKKYLNKMTEDAVYTKLEQSKDELIKVQNEFDNNIRKIGQEMKKAHIDYIKNTKAAMNRDILNEKEKNHYKLLEENQNKLERDQERIDVLLSKERGKDLKAESYDALHTVMGGIVEKQMEIEHNKSKYEIGREAGVYKVTTDMNKGDIFIQKIRDMKKMYRDTIRKAASVSEKIVAMDYILDLAKMERDEYIPDVKDIDIEPILTEKNEFMTEFITRFNKNGGRTRYKGNGVTNVPLSEAVQQHRIEEGEDLVKEEDDFSQRIDTMDQENKKRLYQRRKI